MATVSSYAEVEANAVVVTGRAYWLRALNIRVTPLSDKEVAQVATDAIYSGRHIVIANHNLHSVYLSMHDHAMKSFYECAPYVHVDGMALIILGNLMGIRLRRIHRATSLDFMPMLLPIMVQEGWRLFYLGGRPGIALTGAAVMREEYPGLQIRTHHGYIAEGEAARVIREINEYRPHILMVGMGMPLQEKWIQQYRSGIEANVILPVGAFMDYKASVIPTAPRWLASLYLEWMYRLVTEPRRLWSRYLVEPWLVIGELLLYLLKHRRGLTVDRSLDPPYMREDSAEASVEMVSTVGGSPVGQGGGAGRVESYRAHGSGV